ncbi:MAG: PTS lactose/cellobiose transporter subunit IIA [Culicoidibacterales bacterium]
MEGMELASFQIIAAVGGARSSVMEALKDGREGNFEAAAEKLEEANQYLAEAHKGHTGLIQKEAQGEQLPFSLLFMHAEDQLMTTITLRDIALEMIEMYKKIG